MAFIVAPYNTSYVPISDLLIILQDIKTAADTWKFCSQLGEYYFAPIDGAATANFMKNNFTKTEQTQQVILCSTIFLFKFVRFMSNINDQKKPYAISARLEKIWLEYVAAYEEPIVDGHGIAPVTWPSILFHSNFKVREDVPFSIDAIEPQVWDQETDQEEKDFYRNVIFIEIVDSGAINKIIKEDYDLDNIAIEKGKAIIAISNDAFTKFFKIKVNQVLGSIPKGNLYNKMKSHSPKFISTELNEKLNGLWENFIYLSD